VEEEVKTSPFLFTLRTPFADRRCPGASLGTRPACHLKMGNVHWIDELAIILLHQLTVLNFTESSEGKIPRSSQLCGNMFV
jgi:hypothetical protein